MKKIKLDILSGNRINIQDLSDEIRSEIYNMENKQPPKKMNFFQKIKSKLRFR